MLKYLFSEYDWENFRIKRKWVSFGLGPCKMLENHRHHLLLNGGIWLQKTDIISYSCPPVSTGGTTVLLWNVYQPGLLELTKPDVLLACSGSHSLTSSFPGFQVLFFKSKWRQNSLAKNLTLWYFFCIEAYNVFLGYIKNFWQKQETCASEVVSFALFREDACLPS